MKKIYFILSLAAVALLSACSEDFNEHNFPGYKDAAIPTNVVNYEYTLANADYNAISDTILKLAVTSADSAKAIAIKTNKCFVDSIQFKTGISSLLTNKYIYGDTTSLAKVSFNYSTPFDTLTLASVDKYELIATDYKNKANAGGLGLTTAYISIKSADPSKYLPIWLKSNYPYAVSGNIKLIRYLYDNGVTPLNVYKTYKVFAYDGTLWKEYNSINAVSAKFILKNKGWQFIKSEVFKESFNTSLEEFTSQQVSGTKIDWTWSSKGVTKGTGYAVENAYNKGAVEVWLVSPEITLPNNENLTLSFQHAINYFTGVMNLSELTSMYISTDYVDDVQSATWDNFEIKYPDIASFSFINSGNISLKKYANKKIHIGFKYISTGTAVAWEIKDVTIVEK